MTAAKMLVFDSGPRSADGALGIEIMTALAWITQTLASFALTILAFVAVKSTALGKRFLNHHLEQKSADLKHVHEEKIEALRADLAHLQDRGRRANELEFDAASKIWHAFVDAYQKTQQAIVDYKSFPDLNRLSEDDLTTFLDSTELSSPQRTQVVGASDKVKMYSKITRLRKISTAGPFLLDPVKNEIPYMRRWCAHDDRSSGKW